MGGQNNVTEASFYNVPKNKRMMYQDALSNPGKVDFVYHYGASELNNIASPDDSNSRSAWVCYGAPLTGMDNSTRFKRVTTTTFREVETSNGIVSAYVDNENPELSRLTKLQKGETFAFRLDDSRGSR